MEVPEMKDKKTESQMTSAAAFVEGGIQEACDDACSICLEDFRESDPSTVTTCKHDFHLQCILEWCQRSSQCPMCWQAISLKDPTSQELLDAVVHERSLRAAQSRNAAVFRHPAFRDFELQHLPMGVNDSDIEGRIIQHLAAAAMAREHHLGRRDGPRSRSSAHGHPHFLVFSTQPSAPPSGPVSVAGWGTEPAAITVGNPSAPLTSDAHEQQQHIPHLQTQISSVAPGSTVTATHHHGSYSNDRGSTAHPSSSNLDTPGPSEFQSFSGSLRSKLSAVSMRYRESISKGTREWKERLFSRNSSMSDLGSEVKRELNAGIASVSRLMERLETRDSNRAGGNHLANPSIAETSNQNRVEALGENSPSESSTPAPFAASSRSN